MARQFRAGMEKRLRKLEVKLFGGLKMARHKLSKEEQIRGLRKALANRKTPKQFRAGMEKRLRKLEGR